MDRYVYNGCSDEHKVDIVENTVYKTEELNKLFSRHIKNNPHLKLQRMQQIVKQIKAELLFDTNL
jgi:hypothetical protein